MSEKTRNQEELFIQLLEKADNLLTHFGGSSVESSSAVLDAKLDDYIAFRWRAQNGSGHLIPVKHPNLTGLSDLIGIERQSAELDRKHTAVSTRSACQPRPVVGRPRYW